MVRNRNVSRLGLAQDRRFIGKNGEVLGLLPILSFQKSFASKAALEQFPYCLRSAWHPLRKTPRIDGPEFRRRQHDLEAFASTKLTHCPHLSVPFGKKRNMHNMCHLLTWLH